MRANHVGVAITCWLAACSVADKHPSTGGPTPDGDVPIGGDGIPDTTITEAPPAFAPSGTATFKFTASIADVTFECSVDGETNVACSSPYTRVLPDGAHTFSVRAINKAGKGDATPAEHVWMIDTVSPNTMFTEVPPAADNSVMVRFGFRSSEDNVTFDCSLDSGTYIACESEQQFGPIGDGSHSFAVRAHDRAGNVDASPAVYAWSVDTSTPDTELVSGPIGATGSTSASFTFISPDAGPGAMFECALDGGNFVGCSSPYSAANLAEGAHTFQVRVRDAVGNVDPTPATRTWTVDLSAPDTTIDSGPIGTVRMMTAAFTFSASEMNVTFECNLDAGGYAPCTSPANYSALAQGVHTFAVRATDAAMHVDASPATRTWTVDTIPPDVMFTSGPAEGATSGPRVAFGFTASEGALECSVDGAVFAACASPFAANIPAGAHSFRVRATDVAGNTTMATRNWTVTCDPPSTAGAAGLLHLDDSGQVLANATGGAAATLGATAMAEPSDPAFGTGRFGGGVTFANMQLVAWPAALGAMSDLTIELWVRPDATAGAHDLVTSGDGRAAIRVAAVSPTTVRFTATIGGTATSAAVAAGAWHHVIASKTGSTVRLWVDGVRTEASGGGQAPSLDAIQLGGNYSGSIDEVWIAQTAIADDESALARYCPL